VYKFHPYDRTNLLAGGTLYALKVWINGTPITFHPGDPSGDTFSDLQLKLHTAGTSWPVEWVKVHDNSSDGFTAYDANAAAKTAGATPFKRPENAQFQPGSDFLTFFFVPTGDTDRLSGEMPALAARGAWGSIFRVDLDRHNPTGTIRIVFLGDAAHAAFDNVAFADRCTLLATEDRGDGLHEQLNMLDSVWAFDVCGPHHARPRRLIALGRDTVATATVLGGADGDNEPTGLHVSDGDTSIRELLGRRLETEETRWFVTQQHGMNQVFEILPAERHGERH
jgi:secreted PhoX family phosphatase